MFITSFRKKYGLMLLPTSTADISLGDLIWKRSHRRPRLAKRGMPSHIYNVFLNAGLLLEPEWRKAMTALESATTVPAQLAELDIQTSKRFSYSFPHPLAQKINGILETENQQKYRFSNLEVRILSNKWRLDIQKRMGNLSPVEVDANFKALRPVFMITELYYGELSFSIDKILSQGLAPLLTAGAPLQQDIETEKEIHYTFAHENVPFAMRIEALEGFKA